MAKFVYKMQNILDIKYKLEDQAKGAYTQAKEIYDEQTMILKQLMELKESFENELKICMNSKLNILKIKQFKNAIDNTADRINLQKKEVIKAYKRLNAARETLNKLMIERKTHEKLRENEFEEFMKEMSSQEMKETDELVSFRFNDQELEELGMEE